MRRIGYGDLTILILLNRLGHKREKKDMKRVNSKVRDQVWGQVWGQVRDQVWGQVREINNE